MAADAPRVAIRTLGCKVNRTESEALAERLLASNVSLADDESGADVVVVNTCTVTGEADAKARKAVRHALATATGPVVVTGCLAALDADALRAMSPRVIVEPDKSRLGEVVGEAIGLEVPAAVLVPPRSGPAFRTRAMVKVQDGCDRRCAYCIVPDARGLPRSVPAADLLKRVRSLADAGAPEVVLTGINIGRYADGADVPDLASLIRLIATTGIGRIRVSSIEPPDLTPALLQAVSDTTQVVPHFHVPLQSGCDRTLAEMGRTYDARAFAQVLASARAAVPSLSVTTDVIVGFPGETDADFEESLAFIEGCGFAKLHVFRYSRRAGTTAAAREDQIAPPVSAERAARMRELGERLSHTHAAGLVGASTHVCLERVDGERAHGMSDAALKAEVRGAGLAPGLVVRAVVDAAEGRCLTGTVLESA